ncbi:MAG: hypothetical protein A3J58_02460 [Candidatus Sungbacteria bacterium RIFCSPHIGHO2_02_FULL_52_23]|uniref:TfoX N-terminal domain-containing protein n=1 Tax=Candidatus Sungbacteria bacterium RIFCSPHIGHO2_02_FULL_52_23 TaxID=1802274 RepID=A0A1G2KXD8_9BACT|nr:MAG: hypothetical protein A3J58_02460 [Candidatus Sungbacteria bacterium RIFCSPHIGHO2_02_FULL_52_23]
MRDKGFYEYVIHDLLGGMPGITSRPMFSGWGIYKDGIIFAIIADGELYFKADEENQKYFERLSSTPFSYTMKNGKVSTLSYRILPEEAREDKRELEQWIARSVGASIRAKKRRKK